MRKDEPLLDNPRQRRQLWLMLAFMLVVAGGMLLLPLWREWRLVAALQERVAAGETFALETAADFGWTRACIVPSGLTPAEVVALLGLEFPPALRDDGKSMMVFFDGSGLMAYAEIEAPIYQGGPLCFNVEEQVQVVPAVTSRGAPSFTLQGKPH